LQSRAWSDLLVVEHECKLLKITRPLTRIAHRPLKKWHHVYTVAQARPLKAWLQQKTKHSSMLSGLYEALKENPELDVHFIPVSRFLGQACFKAETLASCFIL
jgi:glycerol-3-phosphate O-acyltransferase